MGVLDAISLTIGVIGLAFGGRCYLELYRWARQCQRARIAVAFKRKVQLQAPLVEWLSWSNQLSADESSSGRVVYRNGGVTVAILKPVKPVGRVGQAILRARRKRASVAPREGRWQGRADKRAEEAA